MHANSGHNHLVLHLTSVLKYSSFFPSLILGPFTSSTKLPKSKRATERRQYVKPGHHLWPWLANPPLLTAFMKLSFPNWFLNLNSLFCLNFIILHVFLHLLNLFEIFGNSSWIKYNFFMIYFIFRLLDKYWVLGLNEPQV